MTTSTDDQLYASKADATFTGTSGNDSMTGSAGYDMMYGLAGDDTLNGGDGWDTLEGGEGNDFLNGGKGGNVASYASATSGVMVDLQAGTATGGAGNDHLTDIPYVTGSAYDDTLVGYDVSVWNILRGEGGNDSVAGGAGNDSLYGGSGDDTLVGGLDPDWLYGDAGSDTVVLAGPALDYVISYDSATTQYWITDKVGGRDGTDFAYGVEFFKFSDTTVAAASAISPGGTTSGNDTVNGTAAAEVIHGMSGNDSLKGGEGADTLFGGEGDDWMEGGGGNDQMDGGSGVDTLSFASATGAVNVNLNDKWATGQGSDTLAIGFEILVGGAFGDTLSGVMGWDDTIYGGAGNDSIHGGKSSNGDDWLYGEAGDDTLAGFMGVDTMEGGSGNDVLLLAGNRADYTIEYHTSTGTYVVVDSQSSRDDTDYVKGVEFFQFADGTLAAEDLDAGTPTGGLNLTGTVGNDVLTGDVGDDTLDGGEGNDTLNGGAGDDILYGGKGQNVVTGGSGNDALNDYGTGSTAVFTGNFADYSATYDAGTNTYTVTDSVADRDGVDTVSVSIATYQFADGTHSPGDLLPANTVNGTSGDDSLDGTAGQDTIYGFGGSDTLEGYTGNDALDGGDGTDFLYAGAGDDTLAGGGGAGNNLFGGEGTDTAVFDGDLADYAVSYIYELGLYTVAAAEIGVDSFLMSIEYLQFADGVHEASEFLPNIVEGTGEDDVMEGTSGEDVLLGLAGNDSLMGLGDVDLLYGGEGNDTLVAGDGDDTLRGEAGDDSLVGGTGTNAYWGGAGNDTISGGEGIDIAFYDEATGAVAVNLQTGVVAGADGNDLLFNVDVVATGEYDDTIIGSDASEGLDGRGGSDSLAGGAGDDSLYGGKGFDILDGGAGDDYLYGGPDNDWVLYDTASAAVNVDLAAGTATGGAGNDALSDLEAVMGSEFDDVLTGNGSANYLAGVLGNDTLTGNDGDDSLLGFLGDDMLYGGKGTDTAFFSGNRADYTITYDSGAYVIVDSMQNRDGTDRVESVENFGFQDGVRTGPQLIPIGGTAGNDLLTGTSNPEVLNGLAGNDTLNGMAGNDTLTGGAGNDTLNGGDGTDTANYAGTALGVKVSLLITKSQATGGAGNDMLVSIENLVGGDGNDALTGNTAGNLIDGGPGNDSVDGGIGVDTLIGGDGNDTFVVNVSDDIVIEYADEGTDTVNTVVTYTLTGSIENLVLGGKLAINGYGTEQDNAITGNGGANILNGYGGNDTLNGGGGADQMYGGKGDDTFFVDHALDVVTEYSGQGTDTVNAAINYTLGADLENLVLSGKAATGTGNAADNSLTGNAAANTLNGAAGNDILDGKDKADILTGGAGDDIFRFTSALAKNIDKITDFNAAADTIELDSAIFTALGEGVLSPSAFQAAATSVAATPDAHIIFNTSSGALLYDVDGSGALKAVQFATIVLTGLAGPVTAEDFVVV